MHRIVFIERIALLEREAMGLCMKWNFYPCLLYTSSFRKIGLTFEEKAFYDLLISLRDQYNFEYGTDKEVDGVAVNDKCKALAKKIKDIIDTKSSFADWLNNQNVRNQLKLDIKICLVKNGYPPQYSPCLLYTSYHGICSRRGKGRKVIWLRRKQLKRH